MSSDLEDFEEQIQQLLSSVESSLTSELNKLRGTERIEKCHYLKNRLQRARQTYRSIQVEIREIQNEEVLAEWEAKAKAFDQQISKLTQDVDWAEKSTMMDKKSAPQPTRNVNDMTNQEITKLVLQTQDKTQESTERSKRLIQETIEIGTAANVELKNQGEKLQQIEENVEQVETNLKRADRQLRIFIRRMASDRIFMVLIVIMMVAILSVVVLTVLQKKCMAPEFFASSKCKKDLYLCKMLGL